MTASVSAEMESGIKDSKTKPVEPKTGKGGSVVRKKSPSVVVTPKELAAIRLCIQHTLDNNDDVLAGDDLPRARAVLSRIKERL